MLTSEQATKAIRQVFPDSDLDVTGPVDYQSVYLFRVIDTSDPIEGAWDPFFSVDKKTGEVRDFSIITDGNQGEIIQLFQEASNGPT
jgi:hypothetical protein